MGISANSQSLHRCIFIDKHHPSHLFVLLRSPQPSACDINCVQLCLNAFSSGSREDEIAVF